MKQQEVFKKIGGIIREINEQYEYLETGGGTLNDLELELLLANSHFLADHIEVLRKLTRQAENATPAIAEAPIVETPPAAVAAAPEPRYFEPEMEQPAEISPAIHEAEEPAQVIEFEMPRQTEPEAITETEIPVAQPEPETIRHELTLEDIGEDWEEDAGEDWEEDEAEEAYHALESIIPEPEAILQEPETAPEPVKTTAVEPQQQIEVEQEILTFNQKMSAQLATSRMSDHLGAQSITDLKSAISLNDKLLYIKDLFNGYSLAYSEAIDLLNRFKTFEEAEKFLQSSYAAKNNWADKQDTVQKFYALLQRRYMA